MAIRLLQLIRYRFLLFAGLLPYCLGSAIAYRATHRFDLKLFLIGLMGIFFALVGVEAFNEYFDWILGTDRVFQLDPKPVLKRKFYAGVAVFFIALLFAIYLTMQVGIGIAIFAVIGFIAAVGYLGPPVKFTYRGFGEIVIALAYGPAMVMGSYYLQTGSTGLSAFIISVIPSLLLFLIAITNEVPDFFQDRLVGKRNICVRVGQKNIVSIYFFTIIFFFVVTAAMLLAHLLPDTAWSVFLLIPLAYRNCKIARATYETPVKFLPVIRGTIVLYLFVMTILTISLCGTP